MSNLKERLKERIELSAESGCGDMPCCIDEMEAAIKKIECLTTEASCAAHNAAEYHDIIRGQRERIAELEATLGRIQIDSDEIIIVAAQTISKYASQALANSEVENNE